MCKRCRGLSKEVVEGSIASSRAIGMNEMIASLILPVNQLQRHLLHAFAFTIAIFWEKACGVSIDLGSAYTKLRPKHSVRKCSTRLAISTALLATFITPNQNDVQLNDIVDIIVDPCSWRSCVCIEETVAISALRKEQLGHRRVRLQSGMSP